MRKVAQEKVKGQKIALDTESKPHLAGTWGSGKGKDGEHFGGA